MRSTRWSFLLVLGLLLFAGAASALEPSPLVQDEAAFLAGLAPVVIADEESCAAAGAAGLGAELVATRAACTATANCGSYAPVSCSSNASSTSCVGVDRNCSAGQRGYVTCSGVTTYCPFCPPIGSCVEGSRRTRTLVDCCTTTKRRDEVDECQNGQWVYIGYQCNPVTRCTLPIDAAPSN